jgi:ABC-type uncharacterized transport system substrate-binding protein
MNDLLEKIMEGAKMLKKTSHFVFFFFALAVSGLISSESYAARFRVFVVMSYGEIYPWVGDLREGIESELSDTCEIRYFYMDTKRSLKQGPQKAKEAYDVFQAIRPDGVIAADDNAQSMFVVPYLKDKVKTPVMFCGVNSEPELYGYPASNVSGVLEREHIGPAIAFAQQLVPSIRTVVHIIKDSPSADAIHKQIEKESAGYSAKIIGYLTPTTLSETINMVEELKTQSDALLTATMQGIVDKDGRPLSDKDVLPIVLKTFGKPVIGTNAFNVKYGILCAVVKLGQEQGATAARMLYKAMTGTPVSQVAIARVPNGKRMINVTTMKELGIEPRPIILQGAELVRTEQ